MEIESVTELTTELFNNIKNRGNNQSTELLKVLVAEHPTNQATIVNTLSELLKLYSEIRPDSRNQAAVDYAKNATKFLETNSIPVI